MAKLSIVKTEPIAAPLHIVSQAPIGVQPFVDTSHVAGAGSLGVPQLEAHPNMPAMQSSLLAPSTYGQSIEDTGKALLKPLLHIPSQIASYGGFKNPADQGGPIQSIVNNPDKGAGVANALTQVGTGILLGKAGEGVAEGFPKVKAALQEKAIGDPNAAALRGLQVGPKSPKALGTIQSVEGARPFLQGAQSMEDLQAKIPMAKAEIWSPYQQAVDAIGDRPVQGPDGMTTVRELESQRVQLSALNRGLKSGSPEAIQLAQQKGMTAAQLLDQETAVKAALDPELASTGIDPQAIRKTFGNVAQVGGRVSGKSTLIEKPQPYGLGKVVSSIGGFDATHPLSSLFKPFQAGVAGVGDIAAGRPIWSGKPTDVAIKDAFANAGTKPNFGQFQMPTTRGLLEAPGIEDSLAPYEFGTPARTSIVPDAPTSFPRLPAAASDGELKPMIWPKANVHPGLADDFASMRIVPSRSKVPSTTLPSETNGLMLGAGERLGLPADVGEQTIDPRFLQKQSYPALNSRTAVEKTPTIFAPKPEMLNGLFTGGPDGEIIPTRKGLPAPSPKPKTIRGKR